MRASTIIRIKTAAIRVWGKIGNEWEIHTNGEMIEAKCRDEGGEFSLHVVAKFENKPPAKIYPIFAKSRWEWTGAQEITANQRKELESKLVTVQCALQWAFDVF